MSASKAKIWIDLDNTPHVPFFRPIIRELERRGYAVVLTARDAFQVCELATRAGLTYKKVGRHYGKSKLLKVLGLVWRSLQLVPFVVRERPALGLSHCSRSQMFLCNLVRIPTVMILDYEHARTPPLVTPRWEIVPEVLSEERLHCGSAARVRTYHGIKEDVYVPEFEPDPTLREQLSLSEGEIVVTVRPPATDAHYHNSESQDLFVRFMDRVLRTPRVKAVLLPRNKTQEQRIREDRPQWFEGSKVVIPKGVVDGLSLLWCSDVVVGAGGTMNREAAALGVPVYSLFRGKIGGVDRHLEKGGRMTLIDSLDDVDDRIVLKTRKKAARPALEPRVALTEIVGHIEDIARQECRL